MSERMVYNIVKPKRGIGNVGHKRKAFTADLKPVYKAPTEESALAAMDELEAKWGEKYALGVKSWRVN